MEDQNADREDELARLLEAFDERLANPEFALSDQKLLANPPVLRHFYARIA